MHYAKFNWLYFHKINNDYWKNAAKDGTPMVQHGKYMHA